MLCFNQMKAYHVTKILKLGFGHGRDTTFFGSKGIEVEALDYSVIAVQILDKIAKEKRPPIKSQSMMLKIDFHFQIIILMPYIHKSFLTPSFH